MVSQHPTGASPSEQGVTGLITYSSALMVELRSTRLCPGCPASMCTLSRADASLHHHRSTQKSVGSCCDRDGRSLPTVQGRQLTARSRLYSDPGDCATNIISQR
ncbi:unnamed protein product [Boreogadus saida]